MPDLEPLTGSPPDLRAAAATLDRAAAGLDDARGAAGRVTATISDQRGDAVSRALLRIERAATRMSATAQVLGAAASAIRTHADVLVGLQEDAIHAIACRRLASAEADRWDAVAEAAAHEAQFLPPGMEQVEAMDRARRATSCRDDALADVVRAEQAWRDARDAKREASIRAAAAIEPLADSRAFSTWLEAGLNDGLNDGPGSGSGSATDVADFQATWRAADQAAQLAKALAGRALSDAQRERALAEVDALLAGTAGDELFWSVFYREATPGEVFTLLELLGAGAGDGNRPGKSAGGASSTTIARARRLVDALSDGMGTWASTLGLTEQRELGRRIVDDGDPLPPDGVAIWEPKAAWAALALSSQAFPQGVYLGAAERLDRLLRTAGPLHLARPLPGTGLTGPFEPTVVGRLSDSPHAANLDVVIFQGLARSETAALDFFAPTDAALGQERVDLWLGSSAFGGWPDGGSALTDALRQAVRTGEATGDVGTQVRAATLAARAMLALPDGLLITRPSDDASVHIADAYAPYVGALGAHVGFGTDGLTHTDKSFCIAPGATPAPVLAEDGQLAIMPDLDPSSVRAVIGTTSLSLAGARRWTQIAAQHQAAVLDATFRPGSTLDGPAADPAKKDVVQSLMRDLGTVSGGMQSGVLQEAQAKDALAAERVQLVSDALGLVPIGGVASRVISDVGGALVVTVAVSAGGSLALDLSAGHFAAALDSAVAAGADEYTLYAVQNFAFATSHAIDGGMDPQVAADTYAYLLPDDEDVHSSFFLRYDRMSGMDLTLADSSCEP